MAAISSYLVEMQQIVASLDANNGFGFIDLRMTEEEKAALESFSVHEDDAYENVQDIALLTEELPVFLCKVGAGDAEKIAELIHRIAIEVIKASGKETAWVTVRASTASDLFDTPRWHIDGIYYTGSSLKFAAALIGSPTLFYRLPTEMRAVFKESANHREVLAHLLTDPPVTGEKGEGAFFRVSDDDKGAVHSEPKMIGSRLFFSVLPGTKAEIAEYVERQKILAELFATMTLDT